MWVYYGAMTVDTGPGASLRKWREKRGLTQQELASVAYMSVSGIQALENGRRPGRRTTWRRLAIALDVPIEALLSEPSGKD